VGGFSTRSRFAPVTANDFTLSRGDHESNQPQFQPLRPTGLTHSMRREIYEQPQAIAKTVGKHLLNDILFSSELHAIESALLTFEKLIIAASGTAT
jgi:glucosamine 6-phosphate synthetase-like amidotransferase/phosphosugar isomerase protein